MHDEIDRHGDPLSPAPSVPTARSGHVALLDVPAAILRAEAAASSRVIAVDSAADRSGVPERLAEARAAAERGERVAVVASAASLAQSREAMRSIARGRLAVVAHAISGSGGEDLAALLDLGWGVLTAAGPEDAFDLALVARRAAEDSGVPFLVVHALANASSPAGRLVAMVGLPAEGDVQAFVGPTSRVKPQSDPSHPSLAPVSDRGFGDRLPFALGAAMREYGTLSGRRHEAVEKHARAEHPLVLVGSGAVGEALVCAAPALRELGFDVAAVNVAAFRPFPGARLVKLLSRALAVAVLEANDEPIAHAGPLVREVKAAFTDALTWVPGFPGIGRIPKLVTGVMGNRFAIDELASVCEALLAAETGARTFSFADHDHMLPRSPHAPPGGEALHAKNASLRLVLDDVQTTDVVVGLVSAALAGCVGVRASSLVRARDGGGGGVSGAVVEVHASRDHARGGMLRRSPALVVASPRGAGAADVLARVGPSALLAVTSEAGAAADLSEDTRSALRERRARVLPLGTGDGSAWGLAGAAAGAAVAVVARAHEVAVDEAALGRLVEEHARAQNGAAELAAEHARRAFTASAAALGAAERDARAARG
jgi:pyruvate-ferredoxin/flavodoxin oxidoreductase